MEKLKPIVDERNHLARYSLNGSRYLVGLI